MPNYWAMKTFKDWASVFENRCEIGIDENGADSNYITDSRQNLISALSNPRLLRRFDQFCKWAEIGDYVIIGTGKTTQFNMQIIGKIKGEYEFDSQYKPYRHFRKIEIIKEFNEPIQIEKWGQVQRIEAIDANDFIDTLVKSI